MELLEAIEKRHSVRSYEDREIAPAVRDELSAFIQQCNQESGLHMQLVLNEPKAFGSFKAHYGTFSGVKNYIAVIGNKSASLEERCGYYGEKVVLKAQQLGLNTCWTAMTYSKIKSAFQIDPGEKLCLVIAVGYGKNQGTGHKIKEPGSSSPVMKKPWPELVLQRGTGSTFSSPTAMNQQKFHIFILEENTVSLRPGSDSIQK